MAPVQSIKVDILLSNLQHSLIFWGQPNSTEEVSLLNICTRQIFLKWKDQNYYQSSKTETITMIITHNKHRIGICTDYKHCCNMEDGKGETSSPGIEPATLNSTFGSQRLFWLYFSTSTLTQTLLFWLNGCCCAARSSVRLYQIPMLLFFSLPLFTTA